MRKLTTKTLALALALIFLFAAAAFAQEVRFTGRCNVRSGPGLDYSILGDMSNGSSLEYTGSTEYDNRGVAWYSVSYKGCDGWVSSKYAKLGGGSSSGNHDSEQSTTGGVTELSQYYGKDIHSSTNALGGGFSAYDWDGEDNVDVTYENSSLWFAARGSSIQEIRVYSGKYSLKGVTIGMSRSSVESKLSSYRVDLDFGDYVVYKIQGSVVLAVEYSGDRVTSLDYGIFS